MNVTNMQQLNEHPNWGDLPTAISRKIVLSSFLMKETDRLNACFENLRTILKNWHGETEENRSDVKRILFTRSDIILSVTFYDDKWGVTAKKVVEKGNRIIIDKIYIDDGDLSMTTAPLWSWDL
jgi:hypothetical protein